MIWFGTRTRCPGWLLAAALITPVLALSASRSADIAALMRAAGHGELTALEAAAPGVSDPALSALVRARVAASRLDSAVAREALATWRASGDRDPGHQAMALSIATDVAFADGDYAEAARTTSRWSALLAVADPDKDAASVAQTHGVAAPLAGTPAQTVASRDPHTIPWLRDKAGLTRVDAAINGTTQQTVLDTGANLSVLSASAAKRLGVRLLDGSSSVASGSRNDVATRMGIADRVELAGVTLHDVVFLVLDDEQLAVPIPGYRIDAIIGFPVLRALGRMRFGADHVFAVETPGNGKDKAGGNLRAVGNNLFVAFRLGDMPVALQLDTGAPRSMLGAAFAARHPAMTKGLKAQTQRTAGAGGTTAMPVVTWKKIPVAIADERMTLPALTIATASSPDVDNETLGILGGDILGAFASYTIDFGSMRVEPGKPLPAATSR
jgi:predicted aspartyl protease